ncbi:MAG: DUF945 domain-containing protein [Gammaproteobacteria bacterium]|nr:DUF945 domain-containing protein [Gammaproteobacteria bacterium]
MNHLSNHDAVGARSVNLHKGQMISSVSSQWNNRPDDERFTSLSDMAEFKRAESAASRANNYDVKDVNIWSPDYTGILAQTDDLRIDLPDTVDPVRPTHWSFGQFCSLIGAPARYMRTLPSQLASDNMNFGLARFPSEVVKVYQRIDGSAEVRAFTGPKYGRIPDYQVIESVMRIAGNGNGDTNWKVPGTMEWGSGVYDPYVPTSKNNTTLFCSDRDIFLFLVDDTHPIEVGRLPNGDPDLMFRGFYVWNSEVGARTLGIATMYMRAVCCNRLLWGVEQFSEIKIKHSRNAMAGFRNQIAPALESYTRGDAQRVVEGVRNAQSTTIARTDEDAMDFLTRRKFSKKQARDIMTAVEEEELRPMRSAWDAAQGITAVARNIGHQDTRLDFEIRAKTILDKV